MKNLSEYIKAESCATPGNTLGAGNPIDGDGNPEPLQKKKKKKKKSEEE